MKNVIMMVMMVVLFGCSTEEAPCSIRPDPVFSSLNISGTQFGTKSTDPYYRHVEYLRGVVLFEDRFQWRTMTGTDVASFALIYALLWREVHDDDGTDVEVARCLERSAFYVAATDESFTNWCHSFDFGCYYPTEEVNLESLADYVAILRPEAYTSWTRTPENLGVFSHFMSRRASQCMYGTTEFEEFPDVVETKELATAEYIRYMRARERLME